MANPESRGSGPRTPDGDRSRVLTGIEKLEFGPPSDIFCRGLEIVLSHLGHPVSYDRLLSASGRGFKLCFNDEKFFFDRHGGQPDPDPEQYLRHDLESAAAAVHCAGFRGEFRKNSDCVRPFEGAESDAAGIRDFVLAGIDEGRPVLALMDDPAHPSRREWTLLTGYESGGRRILGWSCFLPEQLARQDWEESVAVAVRLLGPREESRWPGEREILDRAVACSRAVAGERSFWGFAAWEGWARAVENEGNGEVDAGVLEGRMAYHGHLIGHCAAQKWYSSVFLRGLPSGVFSVHHVLRAAADYARIHELMWDCWDLAGAYWRDAEEEAARFRDPGCRKAIAGTLRKAGQLDRSAVAHLEEALASWEKSHGDYLGS